VIITIQQIIIIMIYSNHHSKTSTSVSVAVDYNNKSHLILEERTSSVTTMEQMIVMKVAIVGLMQLISVMEVESHIVLILLSLLFRKCYHQLKRVNNNKNQGSQSGLVSEGMLITN
jgi:hypothetical protein